MHSGAQQDTKPSADSESDAQNWNYMTEPTEMPDLMTRQDVADMLKVSTATLYRWEREGVWNPRRFELGHTVRYYRDDVRAFLQAHADGSE